jgi:hypothetical protein
LSPGFHLEIAAQNRSLRNPEIRAFCMVSVSWHSSEKSAATLLKRQNPKSKSSRERDAAG